MDPPGIAPESPVCRTGVFLLDHEPFRQVAGVGIEPTPSWFRARRCYQQQPPRSAVLNVLSSNRDSRSPKRFGGKSNSNSVARFHACFVSFVANVWVPEHVACTRERKSTQRESNPHFRHGKPVGYRYIMGAVSAFEMGSDGLEPSPARVRTGCAAANTLIPRFISSIGSEGVEPSSGTYKEPALTVELRAVRFPSRSHQWGRKGSNPRLPD